MDRGFHLQGESCKKPSALKREDAVVRTDWDWDHLVHAGGCDERHLGRPAHDGGRLGLLVAHCRQRPVRRLQRAWKVAVQVDAIAAQPPGYGLLARKMNNASCQYFTRYCAESAQLSP